MDGRKLVRVFEESLLAERHGGLAVKESLFLHGIDEKVSGCRRIRGQGIKWCKP